MLPAPNEAEFELVLHCARTELPPAAVARIRELVSEGPNWSRAMHLAGRHRTVPLLLKAVSTASGDLAPSTVLEQARTVLAFTAARNLSFAREQERLISLLRADDIEAISFKGPVLAQLAYRNLSLRACTDMDILIPTGAYRHAERVLTSSGYRLEGHMAGATGIGKTVFLTISKQAVLRRGSSFGLDLHIGVLPPGYSFAPTLSELLARSRAVNVGGSVLQSFSPEDLLLVLCFHGLKNVWSALKHYCDVAELVRATPNLEWDAVFRRARDSRGERILLLGLHLADQVVGLELPPDVLRRADADRSIRSAAAVLIPALRQLPERHLTRDERFGLHMRLHDSIAGKVRYCLYALARQINAELRAT